MFGSNSRNIEKIVRRDHFSWDLEDAKWGKKQNKKILRSQRRKREQERYEYVDNRE